MLGQLILQLGRDGARAERRGQRIAGTAPRHQGQIAAAHADRAGSAEVDGLEQQRETRNVDIGEDRAGKGAACVAQRPRHHHHPVLAEGERIGPATTGPGEPPSRVRTKYSRSPTSVRGASATPRP